MHLRRKQLIDFYMYVYTYSYTHDTFSATYGGDISFQYISTDSVASTSTKFSISRAATATTAG